MREDIRDNLRGRVTAFIQEKGFGFIEPIDKDGKRIGGRDVFFHIQQGVHVYHEFGVTKWDIYESEHDQLRKPVKGDILVYDLGEDSKGRSNADPWTYEDHLISVRTEASMADYRLVDANGTKLWYGHYSEKYKAVEHFGRLPETLTSDQYFEHFVIRPRHKLEDPKSSWDAVPGDQMALLAEIKAARDFSMSSAS